MSKTQQYLFGPVPSRRLGRSLGVDLIPFKTCTMNCTYCQLGETPCAVSERGDYVPMQDVLAELTAWQAAGGEADHITLAGSGEPTLQEHFSDVFHWAKEHTKKVREEAALADKVKVTLSAWDEASFQQIHRPAQGVNFALLVEGERAFRAEFFGELSVEVFIIEGVNSQFDHVREIAKIVESIHPDRIDINTAVRPPAVAGISASPESHLQALAELFGPKAEVVASFKTQGFQALEISEEALLNLLRRHPATCDQLAKDFNLPEDKVFKTLKHMVAAGLLRSDERTDGIYYFHRD